jgi:hypothetical protein
MISTLWKTCAICAIFIASHLPPWSFPATFARRTAHGREMMSVWGIPERQEIPYSDGLYARPQLTT